MTNGELIEAAKNGDIKTVKKLLAQGVEPNQTNKDGSTALLLATQNGHVDITKELLEQPKIDPNKDNKHGITALLLAAQKGQLNIVEKLLEQPKIDPNKITNYGLTALLQASEKGYFNIVKKLLAHPKIDVNKTEYIGGTALMVALENKHPDIAKELLKHAEIDLNKTDNVGDTALMHAVEKGYFDIVKKLLQNPKIDVNAINDMGQTAYILAKTSKHDEIANELLKNGVYERPAYRNQETVLYKIIVYLFNSGRSKDFIAHFKTGYCNGIATLWVYAKWLETQPNPNNIPRDDYIWFRNTVDFIAHWEQPDINDVDKLNKLAKKFENEAKPYEKIMSHLKELETTNPKEALKLKKLIVGNEKFERFISLIQFFQYPHKYLPTDRFSLDKSLEDTVMGREKDYKSKLQVKKELTEKLNKLKSSKHPQPKEIENLTIRINKLEQEIKKPAEKGKKLTKEYSIASIFNLEQLKQLLKNDIIRNNKLTLVYSSSHATALLKNGENYFYFDPNSKIGEVTTTSLDKITTLIFNAHHFDPSKSSPLGFLIFSFDKKPGKYPAQKDMLDAIKPKLDPEEEYLGLIQAANIGCLKSVRYFLAKGIDPNEAEKFTQYTALLSAANKGHLDVVKELLKHPKTDLNITNKKGETALRCAIENNHLEIVKTLLKAGAKYSDEDFSLAVEKNYQEISSILQTKSESDVYKI